MNRIAMVVSALALCAAGCASGAAPRAPCFGPWTPIGGPAAAGPVKKGVTPRRNPAALADRSTPRGP
jgi:hypothetical protein